MPANTVTCPECGSSLRGATPFTPGKKVKCPRCAAVFRVPDEDEDDAEAFRPASRPATARKAPPPEEAEEEDSPRRPARRRPVEDEDEDEEEREAQRPRRRQPADDEEDEDDDHPRRRRRHDEDDDRPRRRRAGRRQGGGKTLVLVLVIGGVLLLGLGAVGAWVWPGFLKGGGAGGPGGPAAVGVAAGATFTDCKDALAYLPAKCTKVFGVDVAGLRSDAVVGPALKDLIAQMPSKYACVYGDTVGAVERQTGKPFQDCCDYVVWGLSGPAAKVAVFKTNCDLKADDLAAAFRGAQRKDIQGKACYLTHQGEFRAFCLPSPRLLVLVGAFLNDAQLGEILARAGGAPPVLTGDFQTAFAKAARSHLWKIEDQTWTLTVMDNELKNAANVPHYQKKN